MCQMAAISTANVRTIAREAGVSHITVSRALRNSPHVAPATRAKVQEAAERLGYRSNPLVQAYAAQIRRGKGEAAECNLAWLESDLDSHDTPLWLKPQLAAARARAEALGFPLDVGINAHDFSDHQLERLFRNRGVRGVVIPFLGFYYRAPFQAAAMVTVGIGESPAANPMHTVTPDYFRNMTAAFDALLALGYERIGFCEHDVMAVESQGALWGSFLFNQRRVEAKKRVPFLGGLRPESERAQQRFERWLREAKPDVVISSFHQAGEWIAAAGMKTPDDIGLAHLGLSPDVAGWSGVDFEPTAIGAASIDLLASHIIRNEYGVPKIPKLMRIPGRWVNGSTTRAPAPGESDTLPASHNHSHEWFEKNFWSKDSARGTTRL